MTDCLHTLKWESMGALGAKVSCTIATSKYLKLDSLWSSEFCYLKKLQTKHVLVELTFSRSHISIIGTGVQVPTQELWNIYG